MALVPFPGASPSHDPPPAAPDPEEPFLEEEPDGGKMSFLEHLDELRKRLLVSVVALFVGFAICLSFSATIVEFFMRPLTEAIPGGGRLIMTEPTEGFLLHMKMAALAGLVLASPLILWQVWLFIAPGLYAHEKRYAIPFVALATLCFVGGALFSHYVVFPWTWSFFASFGTDYMEFAPKIGPTFSLYTKMLLSFGLVFQLPTLVLFLARMGMITPRFMIRNAKYATLITFIVAAVITPPDVVSQVMVALPMMGLYGISIGIAWLFSKRTKV